MIIFAAIGTILLMGLLGTIMLNAMIDHDILRRILVFLFWVLIVWAICESIKTNNDENTIFSS